MFDILKTVRGAAVLAALALMAVPAIVHAYSVTPMRFELRPSGAEAQTTMTIDNTNAYAMTLEVLPYSIDLGEDGIEVLTPAADDFLIFPPQALIGPGKQQNVRVQYIGDPSIERSRIYRVRVEQIAIDMSGNQDAGVNMALNFSTLASVVPEGATPALSVTSVEAAGPDRARVVIENGGDAYGRMLASEIVLAQDGREATLSGEQLLAMQGQNASGLYLPGRRRALTIVLPDGFAADRMQVSIASD